MTYGSEPRRRRRSSDVSRRTGESRSAGDPRRPSEDDDAEDWLAGFRPDPSREDRDAFSGVAPAFGRSTESAYPTTESASPSSERAFPSFEEHAFPSFEELPKRPGRRRRAEPEHEDRTSPPASVDPTRPAWPETWQEWSDEPAARPGRHSAFPTGDERRAPGEERRVRGDERPFRGPDRSVRSDDRPVRGRRRASEPDDLPTGFSAPPPAAPTRTTATASVPVAGTARPPAPPAAQPPAVQPPVAPPPASPSRRRTAATARVAPPATARVPTTGETRRRPLEDSGTIRRPLHDSGAIRRPPQEPTGRPGRRSTGAGADAARSRPTWLSRVLVVVTVVVLALVGLGGYMLINGRRSSPSGKQPATGAEFKGRDISSRDADPVAMTEPEVFPGKQVTVRSTVYPVLKTQAGECAIAATDDLAKLLTDLGCSQVVRGTLKSADSQFLITAGIFNLKDEASANKAYETIKPTLDAQKGRFTGLAAGDGTEAIVRAPTTLGWHPLGHFLAYCIVAHADGKPIAADDAGSKQVISDVVEGYLRDNVLAARAAAPVSTQK